MKTILVDAINTFINIDDGIFYEMYKMLELFKNKKIILTSANDEQMKMFGLADMPYEVFTLKHNPEKTNPDYYKTMLKHFSLDKKDVVYFEHNGDAVICARSVGINTFHYDLDKKDIIKLKYFIDENI
jgi:FMN phosphatase YigB (HAD superfamily)